MSQSTMRSMTPASGLGQTVRNRPLPARSHVEGNDPAREGVRHDVEHRAIAFFTSRIADRFR